ncbi:MAG: class I SAM-dependent methyltransferase [Planctomycetes bacterium]|nr:class I SAM-dependent methyltransferase [Planctomycetota bacterium]
MSTSERTRQEIALHKTVGRQYKVRYRFPFAMAFQEERNKIILDLLAGETDEETQVLDLGCGTGVMIEALSSRFSSILGLDASMEMMTAVNRNPGNAPKPPIKLIQGDIEALPFENESLERVVCRSILHHAGSLERSLQEVHRVLKPRGKLIVAEPMNDNPLPRMARWIVRHGKSYGKIHTIDKAFMAPHLKAKMREAGFVVDQEVRYGFFAYPLCDNPDLVPLLIYCPFREVLAGALRALDRFLARVPGVRSLSWYAIYETHRPPEGGPLRS